MLTQDVIGNKEMNVEVQERLTYDNDISNSGSFLLQGVCNRETSTLLYLSIEVKISLF